MIVQPAENQNDIRARNLSTTQEDNFYKVLGGTKTDFLDDPSAFSETKRSFHIPHTHPFRSQSGSSAMTSTTKLTRHTKNQQTIDCIQNKHKKMITEFDQIGKDIYENVLSYSRAPGPICQDSINTALSQRLWSLGRDKFVPETARKATNEQIEQTEMAFADMGARFDKLDENKRILRVNVRE